MKKFNLMLVLNLWFAVIMAQVDYNRNALTVTALNFNENHANLVMSRFREMPVPEKFFNNALNNPILDMKGEKRPVNPDVPELFQYIPDAFLIKKLQDQKVAQQILARWFNRQPDGSFNTDVLKERGMYNANDSEFLAASASKRGASTLMDMGLSLVNQSYVLVFDYYEVMNMDEYYVKNKTPDKERTSNGYRVKAKSYLFKLDFGEEVATEFFNKYWFGAADSDKVSKIKAFEEAEFKWTLVSRQIADHQSTQLNPDKNKLVKQKTQEELMDDINKNLMEKILPQMESRSEEMRVKAMVSGVRPIAAKIGKKEGLGFDQRYYIYENQQRKDGSIEKKRIAIVKSMKVADNRNVTEGHTASSQFYQIYGRKVDDKGMFMEQKNDVGMSIYLGNNFKGMQGVNGRMEFYVSRFMGDLVPKDKPAKLLTAIKFYVDGSIDSRKYYEFIGSQSFTKISVGVGKDFYPSRHFHWGPFLGYGVESTDWNDGEDKNTDETDIIEFGARLGINITAKAQLIGSYQWNTLFGGKTTNTSTGESIDMNYDTEYEGRAKPTISAGIRFVF